MATQTVTHAIPASVEPAVVKEVPVTARHPPPADLEKYIPNPGMPRANKAISKENPNGSPNSVPVATPLQQHVMFWDFDGDGVIYPWDTYSGFRKLGFGYLISGLAPFVIHGTFSYPSSHSWIPNPLFPIFIDRMHRTKHGSDSEVYDTEGRFVPQKFEEIFSKYDRENKGGISWRDIQEMVYTNSNVNDPVGWIAERLEWWTLYLLCKDERGIITKEKVRACYDGTLWEQIASEVAAKKAQKRGIFDTVTSTVSSTLESTKKGAAETYESTKKGVAETYESTKKNVSETINTTIETVQKKTA